jgi:hypothetical protein
MNIDGVTPWLQEPIADSEDVRVVFNDKDVHALMILSGVATLYACDPSATFLRRAATSPHSI